MIQAINANNQVRLGSTPAIQSKRANVQAQNISAPYSKDFANASRSIALASANINKAKSAQNVSFKGMQMNELPKNWFFDADLIQIKDHYGVEGEVSERAKSALTNQSREDFEIFKTTGQKSIIPFYKYTPISTTSQWMPDGYVAIKESGECEYFCWHEIKEQFADD